MESECQTAFPNFCQSFSLSFLSFTWRVAQKVMWYLRYIKNEFIHTGQAHRVCRNLQLQDAPSKDSTQRMCHLSNAFHWKPNNRQNSILKLQLRRVLKVTGLKENKNGPSVSKLLFIVIASFRKGTSYPAVLCQAGQISNSTIPIL